MSTSLAGKVAIVTGSADGLGRALVERLTAEGAHVVGVDGSGGDDADRIAGAVAADHGGIDILVNNAARWKLTPVDTAREQALADYAELIATNTRGPFLLQRAVVGSMIERGGGDIVNITIPDVLPPRGEDRTNSPQTDVFNASKWALTGFTQAWALALRKRGVRVNALALGPASPVEHTQLLVDLLAEGPDGRTGETIGWWPGDPVTLPPRRARGEEIR